MHTYTISKSIIHACLLILVLLPPTRHLYYKVYDSAYSACLYSVDKCLQIPNHNPCFWFDVVGVKNMDPYGFAKHAMHQSYGTYCKQ